ncbi:hypothetical protein IWW38_001427 [Coemansia aciculifera]|uniref:Uncharacterized protein n=1 Tax=Coemansia aciculifera TaxID=417176 RepID=A0ACC1M811_9FUNG|nr:hypothetical protein IWW38_001427 [Coemansia aciculifera]
MATTAAAPSQQQQRVPGLYQSASARSVSSVSTAASTGSGGGGGETWVGGKKRDWDNAFISKYQEFEATLQENDRWLALYWQSIAGVKDTKRPNNAITEALKASSARRRGRARMDVRDVFNVDGKTLTLSPVASRFKTSSTWSLRRSFSGNSVQGNNSLDMAMAHMAMMAPRSPFLTNVSGSSEPASLLARSNSAAAKTAAAVKRLQAMAGGGAGGDAVTSSPPPPSSVPTPLSGETVVEITPPPPALPPSTLPVARFTPSAQASTLRDMILLNHRQPSVVKTAHPPPPGLARASSSEAEVTKSELTKSEEDVRERLQCVRIALGRRSMGRIPEKSPASEEEDAVCELAQRRIDDIAKAISPDASDEELEALCRDIDEVASMLPPSDAEEEEVEVAKGKQHFKSTSSDDADEEDTSDDAAEGVLDVVIDVQPIDLRLDAVVVPGGEAHGAPPPSKRKHSDDEKTAAMPPPGNSSRLMNPTSASLSRGRLINSTPSSRGRGRARPAPYSTAAPRNPAAMRTPSVASSSQGSADEAPGSSMVKQPTVMGASRQGRVAEARRKFEQPTAGAAFLGPVAAMRPGYSSIVATEKSKIPKVASKISSEASRINAAAASAPGRRKLATTSTATGANGGSGSELLFKSVARPPTTAAQQHPNKNGVRSQQSRELLSSSQAAADRRVRPAPLKIAATSSAIPVPTKAKGKAVLPPSSSAAESDASKSSADSGRWGLTSMLSVLSPSSWKQQAEEPSAAATAACQTPTPAAGGAGNLKNKIASPYDVTSPQNPYQPRPEHGGGSRAQLVMPTYQDMAVPLRKSSARASSILLKKSQQQRPSNSQMHQQRLINITEGGRLSGASSFRSSFFSDDDAPMPSSSSKVVDMSSPSMPRTKSTPDLLAEDMTTPIRHHGMRQQKPPPRSAIRPSDEYTTIVPPGESYPPDIESEYSDEYSDDEFSPSSAAGGGTRKKKKNDFKIPKWATTPELARGLEMQEKVNPDHIFGRVKPLRINEIFNRPQEPPEEQRRKPRNSSMIWNTNDALTREEELKYIHKMGYDP